MASLPYHHYRHADDRDRPDTVKIILRGQVTRLSRYGRKHPKDTQAAAKFKHAFEARFAAGRLCMLAQDNKPQSKETAQISALAVAHAGSFAAAAG
jgi:hypothetical protein